MTKDPEFRSDLYRGTAPDYDRYRPPYPDVLFDDLIRRLPVSGAGRLLDLACGTGQIAFPLSKSFTEVVAVDQENDAVAFAAAKASSARITNIRWLTASAETVSLDGPFELVAVGSAFHRLKRRVVAERMNSWLQPGGGVALVGGDMPSDGDRPWQKELQDLIVDWMARAGTADRIPAGWDTAMKDDPNEQVLARAGFEYLGKFEFTAEQNWTVPTLIGFMYSTSMLNRRALGAHSEEFERDMAERLGPYSSDGSFRLQAGFAYEFARKPVPR